MATTPGSTADSGTAGLRAYLETLDRDRLVDLLVEAVARHPGLARQVRLVATAGDDDAVLEAVEEAFGTDEPLSYGATLRYARRAGEAADLIEALGDAGRPDLAVAAAARAVDLLVPAMRGADDGSGALAALLHRLLDLHAAALGRAERPTPPAALGAWLAEVQLTGPERAAVRIARYAAALGEDGLAAYREAVLRRWRQAPGDLRVRHAREDLARHDRDVPALVEVIGGGLRRPGQYARLARALSDIGADAEAVAWAERGLREHPEAPAGSGLREFLVGRYAERRPVEEGVAEARAALVATPGLAGYRTLREAARRAGCWAAERDPARALLRERRPDDHIRALLDDGEVAAAWRAAISAEATLSGETWDELARRRAVRRPADAVPVLRRRVDEVLAGRGRDSNQDAVRRLVELREAYRRAGEPEEFETYLRELTLTYQRRPTFLTELTEAGLTG